MVYHDREEQTSPSNAILSVSGNLPRPIQLAKWRYFAFTRLGSAFFNPRWDQLKYFLKNAIALGHESRVAAAFCDSCC